LWSSVWEYCCVVVFNSRHNNLLCCRWQLTTQQIVVSPEHEDILQRKSKQWLKLHYFHGNIIILFYLSMFSLHITVSVQLPLQIGFRFWRHNNLLRCELSATTQQIVVLWVKYNNTTIFPHRTPRHNNWLCCGVLCGWLHNTTNCCVAGFCVGKVVLTGHRVL